MKDVVLLAVSIYLLKQDILRLSVPVRQPVPVSHAFNALRNERRP